MRSDVKLGLAIGGVLLAVLIVYVLVVPGSEQPGAELATAETGVETSVDGSNAGAATTPRTGDAPVATGLNTSNENQQQANGSTSTPPAEPAAPGDASASKQAQAGGFDWDKLLNGEAAGELPSMSANTPIQAPHLQVATTNNPAIAGAPPLQPAEPIAPPIVTESTVTQDAIGRQPTTPTTPPANTGATPAAPARTHVVQPNETYSSIAAAAYGSPNFYPHIQRANPGIDPGRLKPGMKITLPDISTVKPTATAASKNEAAIDPNSQYRVQPNDTLYDISIKLYGKSDRADKLYELNKETIGDNPAKVKPGMVLKLPESPTVTASSR